MAIHKQGNLIKNLSSLFALGIIVCFFLNWVKWGTVPVSAKDMATGNFYSLSETNFGIANPFPEMAFASAVFWLIPALALVTLLLVLARKTYPAFYGGIAGALVLGLAVVYALFTNELTMFDPGIKLGNALLPAFFGAVCCAIGLILCSWQKRWILKLFLIMAPIALSFLAFEQVKKSQLTETFAATKTLKADYTIDALQLINEFVRADSASNARYRGKIVEVTGIVTELNAKDSSATLSMADSTGSYVIFDFEKEQAAKVKALKPGDKIAAKGLCSGSIFSEIMGTQTISFKNAIINN